MRLASDKQSAIIISFLILPYISYRYGDAIKIMGVRAKRKIVGGNM
jgi:hypothetical protein